MTTLEFQNVTKKFKDNIVLDDVSLKVADGETLVLFGPSGSGKTVFLRLVAGVIDPDGGVIRIGGKEMKDVEPEERGIGMAFQNFALFPHMSAFDNIAAPLEASHSTAVRIKSGVDSVAKLLKIDHVLSHRPRALSNGQKQRTALARALADSPSLLLLDDPLRNVDAKLRFEMRLELPRLLEQQGATVVYVTQDYKEAMALGDRIAVMSGGRFRQIGTPEEIYLTPANMDIARLFGDPTINLLDVTPERDKDGVFVHLSDKCVALNPGYSGAVGKPCVLGVRPEAFSIVKGDAVGAIPVEIEAETPLNEKIVTLVRTLRKREILVSRPAGKPGPNSGLAFIAVNATNALLFDKATGNLIALEKQAPEKDARTTAASKSAPAARAAKPASATKAKSAKPARPQAGAPKAPLASPEKAEKAAKPPKPASKAAQPAKPAAPKISRTKPKDKPADLILTEAAKRQLATMVQAGRKAGRK
jgi:multiple sugar transport system ATP-binding protein